MAKSAKGLVVLLVVVALFCGAGYYAYVVTRPTVRVQAAHRGIALNEVFGAVKILPGEAGERDILSQTGGLVVKSNLVTESEVKANEVLLQLDTRQVESEIESLKLHQTEAQTRLDEKDSPATIAKAEAEANLRNAKGQLGGVAQVVLDRSVRELALADQNLKAEQMINDGAVKQLKIEIDQKNLQKERMTIVAPFDGTITKVFAQLNETIEPGPVARIIPTDRIVQARIEPKSYSDIKAGQDAIVTISTYGDREFKAKVIQISKSADPVTQRYLANLQIIGVPDAELKTLLVADLEGLARIEVGKRDGAVLIPAFAWNSGKVLVVKGGVVEERRVKIGFKGNKDYEVLEGVADGELVITDLTTSLRAGDRVKAQIEP